MAARAGSGHRACIEQHRQQPALKVAQRGDAQRSFLIGVHGSAFFGTPSGITGTVPSRWFPVPGRAL